jgi:HEPN domain-containing protein
LVLSIKRKHLDAAVRRIAASLAPEEVILFGSRARGDARPDSDAALLAVLPQVAEALSPDERHRRAWLAVRGDMMQPGVEVDVFAYTVAEMRGHLAAGDTVVRDALSEGTLLHPSAGRRSRYAALAGEWSRVETVAAWLQSAAEDLEEAGGARLPRNALCHAQQAVEKALKALTFHLGADPAQTHDLWQLLVDIAVLNPAIGSRLLAAHQNPAAELTRLSVTPRYPRTGNISSGQAMVAVACAGAIVAAVRRQILGKGT